MFRWRGEIRTRFTPAPKSALGLAVLVGALLGVSLHDADHEFCEGDVRCGACLHADRVDGAATTVPSIPGIRLPDVIVDVRRVVVLDPSRIAKEHGPRAPPFIG